VSLDQATNIAEIVAALATVITLAYLAIQIRSNNNLQKAESRRSVLNHSAQLATAIGQSSEASDVFYRGLTEYSHLESSEKLQFEFMFSVLAGHCSLAFTDWKLGLNDQDSFDTTSREFYRMLKTPGGIEYWKRHGPTSEKDFFNHINENVYNSEPPIYRGQGSSPDKSSKWDADSDSGAGA